MEADAPEHDQQEAGACNWTGALQRSDVNGSLRRAVWDSRGRNQLPPRPTPHAAENTSTRIAPARVGYSAVAERRQRRAFDWLAQGRSAERSRVERSRRQGHTFQVRLQIELWRLAEVEPGLAECRDRRLVNAQLLQGPPRRADGNRPLCLHDADWLDRLSCHRLQLDDVDAAVGNEAISARVARDVDRAACSYGILRRCD